MQNARNSLFRKQGTIFMRKQWTVLVNTKNRFYECSKQIQIYSNNATQFMLLVTTYLSTATMPLNFLFWWFFGLDLKSLYFTIKYLNK